MEHLSHTPDSPPAGIDPAAAALSASGITPGNALTDAHARAHSTLPEPEFGFSPPEHYDPEEYRWVPVRRRPRWDGWTEEKQRRFIEILADTGLVGTAARAVGMSRDAAYKLRRAPHAAAFARAWDVARERAGALIEDVAFERALEGVETEIYDRNGGLTGSKTVYNDRLLTFLLRHLKPERYGTATHMRLRAADAAGSAGAVRGVAPVASPGSAKPPFEPPPEPQALTLEEALRAMEPALPAAPEAMLDPDTLEAELEIADIADGKLPHFLTEQGPVKSDAQLHAEKVAAMYEEGRRMDERMDEADAAGEKRPDMTDEEYTAWCLFIDPSQATDVPRKTRRKR